MKKLALMAVILMTSTAARAQIATSKHDFSSVSGQAGAKGTSDQICIYCHTPHHAIQTRALWNHTMSAIDQYNWVDAATSSYGTPLGFQPTNHTSALCLSCHDGTVAVGSLNNIGGGAAGTITVTGTSVDASGKLLLTAAGNLTVGVAGTTADVSHNHPFAIPYANQTYMTVVSGVPAGKIGSLGGYFDGTTGVVTNTAGDKLTLTKDPTGGAGYGVECATCHDPHNSFAPIPNFLVAPIAGSKLCLTCHNK